MKIKFLEKLLLGVVFGFIFVGAPAFAEEGTTVSVGVSPSSQEINLEAGKETEGSFRIINPMTSDEKIDYVVRVVPYTVINSSYDADFDATSDFTEISNWIFLPKDSGTLNPGESIDCPFVVKVPKNAPAGGQYAAIVVEIPNDDKQEEKGVSLSTRARLATLIYASVAGETYRDGAILLNHIPTYILNSPLSATSLVENTGNVHQTVTYTLQVFPLFSDEEVFTNEEKPKKATVIPGTKLQNEIFWEESPTLGVFRVRQTINFNGKESIEEGIVFLCPKWFFMAVLIFALLCIFWIVYRIIVRRKIQKRSKNDVNFQAN